MTTDFNNSVKTIIVMGSKPNPAFPLIPAEVVITAKSSVLQGLVYRKKYGSKIIALVPWPELETHDYVREALIKSQPEELVVLGDDEEVSPVFVQDILKLNNTKVTTRTYNDRNYSLLKSLGMRKFLLMIHMLWIRGVKSLVTRTLKDMLHKRKMLWLSRSTGINGILYAMERFPNAQEIIVVGIGLVGGGHFDSLGEFTNKSAKSDQIFMRYWPKNKRAHVYTTDDKLHEIGDVPLWSGEVFFETE